MSTKWNAELQFPTNSDFVNRIIGAEFGPSNNSGNPMITIEAEVNTPQEVMIGEKQVTIAGVKAKKYYVTEVKDDPAKTEEKREEVKKLWTDLGLDPSTINWDNIDVSPLRGKLIMTLMSGKKTERRANPTSEQLKKDPKALGPVLKNPATGKALIQWWPQIDEIFGLAPGQDMATGAVPY